MRRACSSPAGLHMSRRSTGRPSPHRYPHLLSRHTALHRLNSSLQFLRIARKVLTLCHPHSRPLYLIPLPRGRARALPREPRTPLATIPPLVRAPAIPDVDGVTGPLAFLGVALILELCGFWPGDPFVLLINEYL